MNNPIKPQTDGVGAVGCSALLGVMVKPFRWLSNLSVLELLIAILAVNSLHLGMQISDILTERQKSRTQSEQPMQCASSTHPAAVPHPTEFETVALQFPGSTSFPAHQNTKELDSPSLDSRYPNSRPECLSVQATQLLSCHYILAHPCDARMTPNDPSSATATGGQASNGIMIIEFSCPGQNGKGSGCWLQRIVRQHGLSRSDDLAY